MATKSMDFSALLSKIDQVTTKKTYDDNSAEFWRLTKDKAGNAAAVIHFLPNKQIDDFPFVRVWTHSFKNEENNRWYIENSLSTIGEQDYIGTLNSELWNTGLEENKEICRKQKRKLNYIANILVIKDLGNPSNNGKVFKYKFGAKIFEKIIGAAKPDESLGETPINAFDTIGGAEFLLKQAQVAGFPNYDASKFNSAKPLFDGDEKKIQEVLDQCFDLNLEIAPEKFKSPEDLKKKYLWVMGLSESGAAKPKQSKEVDEELDMLTKMAAEPAKKVEPKKAPPMPTMDASDDSDDDKFFASLLQDD
jgi:hypothetical protein